MSLESAGAEVVSGSARRLGVPRLPAVHLGRARLDERLAAADHLPLRVVHGGYGYGKTTLLASWARRKETTASALIWVTVDEVSNERLSFWRVVLGLVGACESGSIFRFGAIEVDTLPAALLNVFESLPAPITLVVDSYERLLDDTVERDLLRLLRHTDNLRLVVGTRRWPAFDTHVSEYGIEPLVIDLNALGFDHDDVATLAERLRVQITAAQAASLLAVSAGWPVAVKEMLTSGCGEQSAPDWTRAGVAFVNHRLMHDLSTQPGFPLLLLTSVADSFTVEQAEFLGADAEHFGVLDEMELRGLGTWSAGPQSVFRMNPTIRGALRRDFRRMQAKEMAATYRRLAQWYEQHGEGMRAFEAAVRAEDWARASRYLRRDLIGRDDLGCARKLLLSVPEQKLQGEPLLMFLAALECYIHGGITRAVRYFLSVISLCEAHDNPPARRPRPDDLWIQSALVVSLRLAGRHERVPRAAQKLHRMLMSVEDPEGELVHSNEVIEAQLSITYLHLDRIEDAARMLGIDAVNGASKRMSDEALGLVPLRALLQASRGYIHAARAELDQVRDATLLDVDSLHGVSAHLSDALISLEDFDPDGAEKQLGRAQSHWASAEHWPLIAHALARAQWQRLGAHVALTGLREQRRQRAGHPPISPALAAMLDALEAELLMAIGRGSEARMLLSTNQNSSHPRSAVARARALLLSGRSDQALSFADGRLHDDLPLVDRAHLFLIAASAARRLGDCETALQRFESAVQRAFGTGLRTPFAMMLRSDFLALSAGCLDLRLLIEGRTEVFNDPGVAPQLTTREHVVLKELAEGLTLAEVAARLSVAVKTVKNQAGSLYRKLGVTDRTSAVTVARRRGLL
ncbi:LuxR C-terminal-related transcriptional regulator [Microbacterium sp. A588]